MRLFLNQVLERKETLGRTVDSGRNPCSRPLRYSRVGVECSLLAKSIDCACIHGLSAAKFMSKVRK